MAVETAILPFDPQLVREAIHFEIERGGQVYFVYNNVETIDRMASLAAELGVVIPVSFFERAGQAHYNSVAVVDADGIKSLSPKDRLFLDNMTLPRMGV